MCTLFVEFVLSCFIPAAKIRLFYIKCKSFGPKNMFYGMFFQKN